MDVPTVPSIDVNADLKIESEKMPDDELPEEEKSGKVLLILGTIVGVLILSGVVIFTYLYFKVPEKKESIVVEPSPTPLISEAPVLMLKKEEISFEVLNASEKNGEASRIKTIVEKLGYKVKTVGNAEEKTEGMQLFLSAKLDNQKDVLVADLKKEFPSLFYSGVLESAGVEAKIIVGK
jgi:flagellar basal body-associated protein FliL